MNNTFLFIALNLLMLEHFYSKKLNIKLQDLCPSEYMKTITRLLSVNCITRHQHMSVDLGTHFLLYFSFWAYYMLTAKP
jgi:hypothetical protein